MATQPVGIGQSNRYNEVGLVQTSNDPLTQRLTAVRSRLGGIDNGLCNVGDCSYGPSPETKTASGVGNPEKPQTLSSITTDIEETVAAIEKRLMQLTAFIGA